MKDKPGATGVTCRNAGTRLRPRQPSICDWRVCGLFSRDNGVAVELAWFFFLQKLLERGLLLARAGKIQFPLARRLMSRPRRPSSLLTFSHSLIGSVRRLVRPTERSLVTSNALPVCNSKFKRRRCANSSALPSGLGNRLVNKRSEGPR